jgi:beta-lactamase superfamily II metal-dependent hydrolase
MRHPRALLVLFAALIIVVIAVVTVTFFTKAFSSRAELRVVALDVGQGDGILVEFPSGNRWLIDGGPDERVIEILDRLMPFSERRLNGIILTHPHADHVTGLIHVLRRYDVERVLLSTATHTTPEYLEFLQEMREQKIGVTFVNHPFVWSGEDNRVPWQWEFLYPERDISEPVSDLNAVSVVSRLTFGRQSFLFMGDATNEVEDLLVKQGRDLRAAVLKVGHHGSATSSGADFLQAVRPQYAVISVGAENKFGHPSPLTLKRLNAVGTEIYRTDERGWVEFHTDGKSLNVATER